MISCFPAPYPDEVLYSVVARYHLSSGNPIFRQTMDELFGVKKTALSMVLPQRLNVLADRVPSLPFERLLLEHTMYPYYMAFTSLKNEEAVHTWAKEGKAGSIDGFLGQYGTACGGPAHLRFCPECYAEEIRQYGEGYWHREHQTPGVLFCGRHHQPLAETMIPYLTRDRKTAAAAVPKNFFPAIYPMPLSPLGRQQAIQIADDTHFLYSNYERVRAAFARHQYSFRNLYLQALRHKGLASHHGSLRMEKYQDAFSQFFDSDLLKVLRVDFSHTTVRPWIITICRERKNSHYPLYHILMAQFLYGGLERLVKQAETVSPEDIAVPKRSVGPVADEEAKRVAYRHRWLSACAAHPGAGQNEIRKADSAAYTWLNRHDKEWLRCHPEERKPRGGNKTFADWEKRDLELSGKIAPSAERLRARLGKPVQITATKLLIEAGCGRLRANVLKKLPMTEREIQKYAEDSTAFRLRKIRWAKQELCARGEPAVKWRILKLAGIRDEDWAAMWDLYTSQTGGNWGIA